MKIDFEYTTDYGVFRDAITLPDDHSYTDDELEAMKVSRRDKWIAVVTAPSEDNSFRLLEPLSSLARSRPLALRAIVVFGCVPLQKA
jgi:hypothetical protein